MEEDSEGSFPSDPEDYGEDMSLEGDAEQFDITLPESHAYMGGLSPLSGRAGTNYGWTGRVLCRAHRTPVLPGEMVPLLLPRYSADQDTYMFASIAAAHPDERIFVLLAIDESGLLLSGFGALCEIYEAGYIQDEEGDQVYTVKARALHRCRLVDKTKYGEPYHLYSSLKPLEVEVPGEAEDGDGLRLCGLRGLDPLRDASRHGPRSARDALARSRDAVVTQWPRFVHDLMSYRRLRSEVLLLLGCSSAPSGAGPLSWWAGRGAALGANARLRLLREDHALSRLWKALADLRTNSVVACDGCGASLSRRSDVVPMSSAGVGAHYTNAGGHVHDVLTVLRVEGVRLSGSPSREFSWFPGYVWTIALCECCGAHLGWKFVAEKRTLRPLEFYGLSRNSIRPHSPVDVSTEI